MGGLMEPVQATTTLATAFSGGTSSCLIAGLLLILPR
jgi:hypothetical protein